MGGEQDKGPKSGREAPPSFQFYPGDFLSSPKVRNMSRAERGDYITLLCDCWSAQGLPLGHQELADSLGIDLEEFEELWAGRLGRCFEEIDGRYWNPRLHREWTRLVGFKEAMSEAGKRGAQARKAKGRPSQAKATLEPPLSQAAEDPKPGLAPSPTQPSPTQQQQRAREAEPQPPEPSPQAEPPAGVDAAAAEPLAQPEGQAAPEPPPGSTDPPKAKLGAGSSVFATELSQHLDAKAAPELIGILQELCEAHGTDPVRRWAGERVRAWKARSGAGTGLLVRMVSSDPFVDPAPPQVAREHKPREPEPEPAPRLFPVSLMFRLRGEDRAEHDRLAKLPPAEIASALQERYPDDEWWATRAPHPHKEPAA